MKKILALALCLLVATSSLTALAASTSDTSVHQEFHLWMASYPSDYYASYSDNPCIKYLNEKFNVKLTIEQPAAGTESDALSLMFGTGEYADMIDIVQYTGSITELYEDGVIINVAEYLDYMPNFVAKIEANEGLRRRVYNDDGQILVLPNFHAAPDKVWGGMLYRRDILESVTEGNVQFPSGNDEPTTLADWDYMLPLFDKYFKQQSKAEYACMILPFNGYFHYGELCTGFGFNSSDFYVDNGGVSHGLLDEGLYTYLTKMHEWYEAGYIYKDFASRVNDMFFLPNTALTYGGSAGIWYGLLSQVGQLMNPAFDVRPLKTPIVDGVPVEGFLNRRSPAYEGDGSGAVITKACPDIPRLLSLIDYLYSDEGGMLVTYGLNKEQIPASDTLLKSLGLEEGSYWYDESGKLVVNPLLDLAGGTLGMGELDAQRLPGFRNNVKERDAWSESTLYADTVWGAYDGGSKRKLPGALSLSSEDEVYVQDAIVTLRDYTSAMIPKFIMGTESLDEASFQKFVSQVKAYGLEKMVAIYQDAYDRYGAR